MVIAVYHGCVTPGERLFLIGSISASALTQSEDPQTRPAMRRLRDGTDRERHLGAEDRARLAAVVSDRNHLQKHVQRAPIVLLSAERLPVLGVAPVFQPRREQWTGSGISWRPGELPPPPAIRKHSHLPLLLVYEFSASFFSISLCPWW